MKSILKVDNPVFGVIGGGSFATAIVKLLVYNGRKLNWYMRDRDAIEHIRKYHHHTKYLTAVELNAEKFDITDDIDKVVKESDILIFAIPSAYFLAQVEKITASFDGKFILSAIKGFVGEKYDTVAEYFHDSRNIPFDRIGVIAGPCHAEEISLERLSYITISSKHLDVSEYICKFFRNYFVKAIPENDIYGVEYAAALKNVYAIACGICAGLGYGDNFMAVMISGCFREMKEFINATNPNTHRNTSKSAYLGDLLVTCTSPFSRNRSFGRMLGRGLSVETAKGEMTQVAEGYYASKAIKTINSTLGVDMPIADAVYEILYNGRFARSVMKVLENSLI